MRTLIVGAGRAGQALARDLCGDRNHGPQEPHGQYGQHSLHPIGFVDDARDAKSETGSPLPLPFLGTLADTPRLVNEHKAEAVVLAIPELPTARVRELTSEAVSAGAVVRYLPWYTAALSREPASSDLRPLDIRALINGPEPHAASPEVKEIVAGKRVLVTGADGPLGSEISCQLNAFSPGSLFLLNNRDRLDRLDETDQIFRELRPDVVFHAAGLRNAAVLERRPSHGVKETVLGTDNLVRAAISHGTERFIHLSTDADPTSMLGASHRVAETVVQAAAHQSTNQGDQSVFATVRIGDVLNARDSLLTTLPDQIRAGGPVTITHPEAARCFATVEEAVALALDAARMATGGEVYALDLGEPMRVADVVSRFTRQYRLPEVPIRYVGLRQRQNLSATADRVPTPQPQIFTATADVGPVEYARLPERLEKLYRAAAKNRDPRVRQMLVKLAASAA